MQCKRLIQINPDWFLLLRNISQMLVQFYLVDSEGVIFAKKHHKQTTFCDPKLLVGKVTTCSQTAAISLVEGVECSFAAKHVGINHIFQTSHSRVSELYKQESCNHRNKKCTLNYHPQFALCHKPSQYQYNPNKRCPVMQIRLFNDIPVVCNTIIIIRIAFKRRIQP